MKPRRLAVLLTAFAALLNQACGGATSAAAGPTSTEKPAMSNSPSISRPSAPEVPPVEHAGVRYVQDQTDERQGDQAGGYLAALDAKSGARLWRLKVYEVPDHRAAGVSSGGLYFRSMRLAPGGNALEIVNEAGAIFLVDLAKHSATQVGGPPAGASAPAAKPVPPKPTPP